MPPIVAPLPAITTPVAAITTTSAHAKSQSSSSISASQPPTSIEAKLVILGAQGVGKTSLVNRFLDPHCSLPTSTQATIGASFVTKRIHDPDSNTTVRLQIWDTAGQERFRTISRLYYRGADAGLLCYDVTSEESWEEMKTWLEEMRENCDFANGGSRTGMVIHVVGTKTDLVTADPDKRAVPFEKTISYIAGYLSGQPMVHTSRVSTSPPQMKPINSSNLIRSPDSKRSSGFWAQDLGWDSCHEISSKDNDGIEEVFRVIARRLIEQRNKHETWDENHVSAVLSLNDGHRASDDYFSSHGRSTANGGREHTSAVRFGHGDRRRSWLGPTMNTPGNDIGTASVTSLGVDYRDDNETGKQRRCC